MRHCTMAILALLLVTACSDSGSFPSTSDSGLTQDGGGAPAPDQGATPAADSAPADQDAGQPLPTADGAAPAPSCGPSALPLTRFPAAMRTTKSGRVFEGWGGASAPGVAQRDPVILVHGNGGTADGWLSFRPYFCNAGYGDLELWAITFQNYNCSGPCSSGSNTQHAEELAKMVELVRTQTQAKRVSIVAVSMGVPTARYYVKYLGGVQKNEVALAYLVSGPNHGLSDCDIPGAAYINVACAELDSVALSSGWLHDLNTPDETPSGQDDNLPPDKTITYRTVSFDGDPFYPGSYVSSPKLAGADNLVLSGNEHAVIDMQDLLAYLGKASVVP
jgi:pimeloyl-ACP methyl ester carboxylesterase